MKLNRELLKEVIKAETLGLRQVKRELRAPNRPITAAEAKKLRSAKLTATIHHSIMAHARGKLHLTKQWSDRDKCFYPLSMEHQEKLIQEERKKFLIPDGLDIAIVEAQAEAEKERAASKTA